MKVVELEGEALNLWVAKAEGVEYSVERSSIDWWVCADTGCTPFDHYSPSTDWAIGGTIIEQQRISIKQPQDGGAYAYFDHLDVTAAGSTPLIAAMRAYVASKFGEEVPDSAKDAPSESMG
jgi:hypothetical protein